MSKKIMKRSLALGALMAFVITGSAWAEEKQYNKANCAGINLSNGIDVVNSTFDGCYAKKGGAINSNSDDSLIKNSKFLNNKAISPYEKNTSDYRKTYYNYTGGALSVNTGTITLDGTEFKNNSATYWGGAIELQKESSKLNLMGTNHFIGNKADYAGAIALGYGATVNFGDNSDSGSSSYTKLEGNEAQSGGAIYWDRNGGVLNFYSNVDFNNNTATAKNGNGGAIYNTGGTSKGVINFINGTVNFNGNSAGYYGGAIYNEGVINFGVAPEAREENKESKVIVIYTGNTASGKDNDIYNKGAINIYEEATVKIFSGMNGSGTTNLKGGTLWLGGNTEIGTLDVTNNGKVVFVEDGHLDVGKASGALTITKGNKETGELLTADNLNTVADLNTVAKELGVSKAVKDGDKFTAKIIMAEGDIVGETTGIITYADEQGDDGYYHGYILEENRIEAPKPANEAISDTAIGMKLHWRAHVNDMNKRMGELRDANGEHGVWTRMVRGESEYKNTKAQYNQYQLGYDEKLSVDKRWTVGAAVTFSEGDASYGYGSTEDKSTAFAIYGSKLNNDGTFVDLIARYAHLESDVDDQAGKGSYSANGMSVSAEFGKRIQQGNGLWIEPQAELTYGTIDSAEYKLGTKIVEVGDMDSLIGRVGFRIGKDIEKGNVYARASYLYDFEGETENAFRNDTARRSFNEDLGGGWWEVGVGANINLSKATYIYADVEKTFGGEVDTNWQWNLGVRYSF